MGADCGIKLKSGDLCGVPAIGRCIDCECAFCPTHQGYRIHGFHEPYINLCSKCVALREANRVKQQQEVIAKEEEAKKYVKDGAAARDLVSAGVPSVTIYDFYHHTVEWRGLFGRYQSRTDTKTLTYRGWILGDLRWQFYERLWDSTEHKSDADWLTALVDISTTLDPLTRVKPSKDGYEALDHVNSSEVLELRRKERQEYERITGRKYDVKVWSQYSFHSSFTQLAEIIRQLIESHKNGGK